MISQANGDARRIFSRCTPFLVRRASDTIRRGDRTIVAKDRTDMAKSAKKSETHAKAEKKSPAKAADTKSHAAKGATAKSSKPAAAKPAQHSKPMMSPLIDTSFVASSAARMLVAGVGGKNQQKQQQSNKPESSLFKQMKSGLNKPHSAAMDSLLDKTHGPSTQKTQGFEKQVAHNQTVGTDATRKSVPRRTAG